MSLKIGEVEAKPGTKVSSEIKITELHEGTQLSIPFIIINGVKPGPVLLVTSGMETSYNAIEAVRRLSKIDPQKLKGTLVVVPIMNKLAYLTKKRTGLFGAFPGKSDGTVTERIANVITNEFIPKANYYIHLMNGGVGGPLRVRKALTYPCPDDLLEKEIELAIAFGASFIEEGHNKITSRLDNRAMTIACHKGVPAIMSIQGIGGILDENIIECQLKGIMNIMKYYNMIEGKPEIPKEFTVWDRKVFPRSKYGGFFQLKVALGEKVSEGQIVAEVTDEFYNVKEQILSPVTGVITQIPTIPIVEIGEELGLKIATYYCDSASAKEIYELAKDRPPAP